jgi:hypothetical protein
MVFRGAGIPGAAGNPCLWAALIAFCLALALSCALPPGRRSRGKPRAASHRFTVACFSLSLALAFFWLGVFLAGWSAQLRPSVLLFGLCLLPLCLIGIRWKLAVGFPLLAFYSFCLVFFSWVLRDWSPMPAGDADIPLTLASLNAGLADKAGGERRYLLKALDGRGETPPDLVFADISLSEPTLGLLVQRLEIGEPWALVGLRDAYRVIGCVDSAARLFPFSRVLRKIPSTWVFPISQGSAFHIPALRYQVESLEPRSFKELETASVVYVHHALEWR